MKKRTLKSTDKVFSKEHYDYIKGLRKRSLLIWLSRFLLLFILLGVWEFFAYLKIIDSFIFSSPSKIAVTLFNLFEKNNMLMHIGVTLYETVLGFLIAAFLGSLIALLLWTSDFLQKVLEPYLVVLNSLPKIALGPIIIVAFGSGVKAIVFMAILIGIIVTVINMLGGFLSTDKDKILLMRSMGATKWQIMKKLIIPGNVKVFISTLKIDVGMAWIGSIMGEYIASKAGLGYLLVYGAQVFKLDLVMATIVVLCILASLMYSLVVLLEKIIVKN